jgi:hypothetical protein
VAKRDRCECLHCKELFLPNARNWWHQKFCTKPGCRKASKTESQRRWLSKPQNQDYFRNSINVDHVRQWRKEHPGYWKRPAKAPVALQEILMTQVSDKEPVAKTTSLPPLQDFVASQDPLLLGLIAHLIDSPLQENVEQATLRLLQKGRNILDLRSGMKTKGNTYADQKTSPVRGTTPTGSGPIQLGGSTPGASALSPPM